jgi:hypothetical protein
LPAVPLTARRLTKVYMHFKRRRLGHGGGAPPTVSDVHPTPLPTPFFPSPIIKHVENICVDHPSDPPLHPKNNTFEKPSNLSFIIDRGESTRIIRDYMCVVLFKQLKIREMQRVTH